ncbi:hypothetical protein [Photobacterium sp. R1]
MAICEFDVETFRYNIDSNMEATGMPTVQNVYGTALAVLAAIKSVDEAITARGTLTQMSFTKATTTTAGAILASYWAGVALGSALMATKRATRCDLGELKSFAEQIGLRGGWIEETVARYPEILRWHA